MNATDGQMHEFEAVLDAVDLVLWDNDNMVGGASGYYCGDPHRVVEVVRGPFEESLGLRLVMHRRVNNQWARDEKATAKFYLSRQQVEQLRTYLQAVPTGK
jgi:hypothetical protein